MKTIVISIFLLIFTGLMTYLFRELFLIIKNIFKFKNNTISNYEEIIKNYENMLNIKKENINMLLDIMIHLLLFADSNTFYISLKTNEKEFEKFLDTIRKQNKIEDKNGTENSNNGEE